VGTAAFLTLVRLRREADRVILTTCQEKGAQLETFQAISQKLGNKTASEVRAWGAEARICCREWGKGVERKERWRFVATFVSQTQL